MAQHRILSLFLILSLGIMVADASAQMSKLNPVHEPTEQEFAETFQKGPNRDYSTGPLWTWNDRLTEQQVRETLRDLAGQNVKQVWVHPRPGLMTPYLAEEWFDRWKEALDEAKKLDMNVWIYDENSYPSGFAGGFVPDAMPESRGMGLLFAEVEKLDRIGENIWYVFSPESDGEFTNITEKAKAAGKLDTLEGGKKYLIGRVQYTSPGSWFGGKWYVDLLKKGVTEKFIEITFDAYKNVPEIREEFGKRVPGIFTDEPHPAGTYVGTWVSWNEEIPELFQNKFGYSLVDNLPSLNRQVGDWKKIRHDYHALILELFVDRWAKLCFEWCEANNMEFTGHYWEHGWPGTSHGPDNMAMYIWHQRPAIDILMNQYSESVGAQFGNVRSVKEVASVINQMGHSRNLCELYGAGGWDLRFEDMKRQADWLQVLGVNTVNEHLSYVTLRGARKRDHPQSFSYHSPWFQGYHTLANRNTRLQYALSQGRQVNRILVIEPTTTAWMYQGESKLGEIGNSFQNLVNAMEKANIEYDLGSEDIIARLGHGGDGKLTVGKAAYEVVVLPPNMENIESKTLIHLYAAAKSGCQIMYFEKPKFLDGIDPTQAEYLGKNNHAVGVVAWFENFDKIENTQKVNLEQLLIATWNRTAGEGIRFAPDELPNVFVQANGILKEQRAKGNTEYTPPPKSGQVYHHRRKLGNQDVVFITNVSIDEPAAGWVCSNKDHVDQWNLDTGEITPYPCEEVGRPYMQFRYELPPCGSILLVLSGDTRISQRNNPTAPDVPKEWYFPFENKAKTVYKPLDAPAIKRLESNVLVLDYMDVTSKGETLKDVYFHRANHWVFEKNGQEIDLPRNPWDNGVQFKDELITKKFPADSGFTASYKFTINEKVPTDLQIVIERADLYEITCNDKPVKVDTTKWWLDKAFYKLDISELANVGENVVSITAKPMTIYHELEPAYLLGDFSLESAEKGFVVCPAKPIELRTPEPKEKITTHSSELERVSWLTKGIGFHNDDVKNGDVDPYLVFDLGKECDLASVKVWNYSERGLTKRGVNEMKVFTSPTPNPNDSQRKLIANVKLPEGSANGPYDLLKEMSSLLKARYLVLEIKSNHNGIAYPVSGTNLERTKNSDNGFVGLAEVRFYGNDGKVVENVKIANKSSELVIATHDRKADYLLDGSGLEPYQSQQGWNRQGMPFYSDSVSYTETFELGEKINGTYSVKLPDSPTGWYGSTAKVVVNGKEAGYIGWAPWSLDITSFVKLGKNSVEVIVIGTPKNLLGPYHGGAVRGTAWPGMFWNAPNPQPPGTSYDNIGYGLFEPFTLELVGN